MTCLAAAPPRSWRDGPVRYLLTAEEHAAYGKLASDEARTAFVERFWARLDPDPATPANEFRETYEARCATAAVRFESIGGPAWASDRGRVFLLLGEPQAVRRETAGLLAVEKEVWVYATGDTPSGAEIPFFRCPDGGYRLDPACPPHDPRSASTEWIRGNAERWKTFGWGTPTRHEIEAFVSSITGMDDPVRAAGEARGAPRREAAEPGPSPFADAAYFFRAQDGSVLTMLAVQLPERDPGTTDAAGSLLAGVTLEDRSGSGPRSLLLERGPAIDGGPVFLGRTHLPAKSSHAARYAVKDEARDEILVRHRRLDVPDLSGFAASSVVPAERFGPAGPDERLVVGSEEVLPRPGAVFKKGEMLRLYLQVYGAAEDARTSMPRVDVSFRFTCDAKERPRAIRQPFKVTGAAGASMGLALPIGDWPVGAYRVDVDLHDRVAGERATVSGAFRIVAR